MRFLLFLSLFIAYHFIGYCQSAITIAGGGIGDGQLPNTLPVDGPIDVAIDSKGNLYILEAGRSTVRRIDKSSGKIWTVAGSYPRPGYSPNFDPEGKHGDGGPATGNTVVFDRPECLAFDNNDNLYIADSGPNKNIRRVDAITGEISSLLFSAESITFDKENNMYVAQDSRILKYNLETMNVTVVAGGKMIYDPSVGYERRYGYWGDGGIATEAQLSLCRAITFDNYGNLLIADTENYAIRRVDKETNTISTIAGRGEKVTDGFAAVETRFFGRPQGIEIDDQNNIYISLGLGGDDYSSNVIMKIDRETQIVSTIAGNESGDRYAENVPATNVRLDEPRGFSIDSDGNIIFADLANLFVRKVDGETGILSNVAGNGTPRYYGENIPATDAQLSYPSDLALDNEGNIYIADKSNSTVRKVDKETNIITRIAGIGSKPYGVPYEDGIEATNASLFNLKAIAFDAMGTLYISYADRIVKIDPITQTTKAVVTGFYPSKMAFDQAGNLYFVNNQYVDGAQFFSIQKWDALSGNVTLVAGTAQYAPFEEGMPASSAYFENFIDDVAIDKDENVLILYPHYNFKNVYKVDKATQKLTKLVDAPHQITSLFVKKNGDLYLGSSYLNDEWTEYNSTVWKVDATGNLNTIYEGLKIPIANVNVDDAGKIYVLVDGGGDVFRTENRVARLDSRSTQHVTFAPFAVLNGSGHKLNATASSGLPVRFEVSDASILTIDDLNSVTLKSPGSTFVTAYQDGDENFAPAIPVRQYIYASNITGIEESVTSGIFYPNPSAGSFQAIVNSPFVYFKVYNISGMEIRAGKIFSEDGLITIDLSDLDKNLYLIKLQTKTGVSFQRLIRN